MDRTALMFYVIVAPTVMGVLVVLALVASPFDVGVSMAVAAVLGAVLGWPATLMLVKAMKAEKRVAMN